MSGEYWKRVEQIVQEDERRRQADEQRRLAAEAEKERQRQKSLIAFREHERREQEAREAKLERIVSRLTPILEDIRIHSPEIRNAPQSNITRVFSGYKYIQDWQAEEAERRHGSKIVLQWGKKLEPTPRETAVINSKRKPLLFPSVIVVKDFAHIDVEISAYLGDGHIAVDGDPYYHDLAVLGISKFLVDANAILPLIAQVIRHPNREVYSYRFNDQDSAWYLHFSDNNGHPVFIPPPGSESKP